MSLWLAKLACLPPAATSSFTLLFTSRVLSAGTVWNHEPWLPGCKPIRLNSFTRKSSVRCAPAVPGLRPPNASEASVLSKRAKSAALIAGASATCAASGLVAAAAAACHGSTATPSAASITEIIARMGTPPISGISRLCNARLPGCPCDAPRQPASPSRCTRVRQAFSAAAGLPSQGNRPRWAQTRLICTSRRSDRLTRLRPSRLA